MKVKKKNLLFSLFIFFWLTPHALSQSVSKKTGRVEVLIFDNFKNKSSETKVYFYEDKEASSLSSREPIELQIPESSSFPKTGQIIEVDCIDEPGNICPVLQWRELEYTPKVEEEIKIGELKAAWIIIDVSDVNADLTEENAKNKMDITDEWFQNASFGQLSMNKDVDEDGEYDLFRIKVEDYSKEEDGCQFAQLGLKAVELLENEGVDFSPYHYKLFILPKLGCGFGGVAYLNCGNNCRAFVQSWNWNLVYVHELGHNLGRHHAATDPENDGVYNSEYGDASCPMGNKLGKGYFNAPHSIHMGWSTQEGGDVETLESKTGSYTLPAFHLNSENPRIYHFNSANRNYYLSYRQQTEFDKIKESYTTGINLHSKPQARTHFIQTIEPGETFQNQNFTITTTSVNETEATFDLNFCKTKPKMTKPFFYKRVPEGESLTMGFKLTYSEAEGCPARTYKLTPQMDGLTGSLSANEVTLDPGTNQTIELTVNIPEGPSEYTFSLEAEHTDSGTKISKSVEVLASSSDSHFKPLLARHFYKGLWISLPPFNSLVENRIDFLNEIVRPAPGGPSRYALSFRGFLKLEPGTYTFHLDSDDGSRIRLHHRNFINHNGLNEMGTPKTKNLKLTEADFVPFEVQYFNYDGSQGLEVLMSQEGEEPQPIPSELFYHFGPNYEADETVLSFVQIESDDFKDSDDAFVATLPGCYTNPIPIVKAQTTRGKMPYTIEAEFDGCTADGRSRVKIYANEFEYQDQYHTKEVFGVLLAQEGYFELSDGTLLETSRHHHKNGWGKKITLKEPLREAPTVHFSTTLSAEEEHARIARLVPSSGPESLKIKIQAEEKYEAEGVKSHSEVGFMSIKPSEGSSLLTKTVPTNHNWLKVIFPTHNSYNSTYFTQSITLNGWDPAVVRAHRDGVNAIRVQVKEETSFDLEEDHSYEKINILYIPSVEGSFTGVPVE